ncbi:hypothetical protein B0H13DRAFT_2303607 [Mycena leptocephala]|nr:hypothetical protein B0H13DRAFT_2303607 [Mycena leptocephala]
MSIPAQPQSPAQPDAATTPAVAVVENSSAYIDGSPSIGTGLDPPETTAKFGDTPSVENDKIIDATNNLTETSGKQSDSNEKIAFWTEYMKLAKEFDKDFLRKYGEDLDTALIFAGLFSAVSSAFIIQIQPQLQADPNVTTQILLLALVLNITGAAPVGLQIPQQTGPPTIIVVTQGILYFSLLCTLLVALLAVLGKQWLLHYDSIGEKGTTEERGLERQRKLDGLKRWKFDLVMQIFPLLLQLSLLLFAAALSVYLWTVHQVIADIVLSLTSLGFVLYASMVISAAVSPDSPFQTSLNFLLERFIHGILPSGWLHTSDQRVHSPAKYSAEVPAVLWALETSTNPALVETATAIVPVLKWPAPKELQTLLKRLSDTFNGCFFADGTLRAGMEPRKTSCISAFGALLKIQDMALPVIRSIPAHQLSEEHLQTVLGQYDPEKSDVNASVFEDLVYCINSFFDQRVFAEDQR